MKRTKQERGITLIALIITIVVLLILAVVAVSSIQNDGILHYAINAADSWNKAQTNEQDTLITYEEFLKHQSCPGHQYDAEGKCTKCGYKLCGEKHANVKIEYTTDWGNTHFKNEICEDCGTTITSVEESHSTENGEVRYSTAQDTEEPGYHFELALCACGFPVWNGDYKCEEDANNDGICDECKNCIHKNMSISWETDEYRGTHCKQSSCTDCGLFYSGEDEVCITSPYEYNDNVEICDICGWHYSW